ncbi:hypothetical protein CWE15_01200 [Aliidiomarina taiwanensis]|uniref:DUF4381 domain-containing protein n=1 Tax=Aliidiomarina taiwanensis TaxID=946228 RepID=A0A432X8W3_9GAMM|nr:DUF4381 domain-containing protein [Aliidiomarina taiwanensis]RUO43843.1 hypothetical protein CWE15_01200 [Aliidiomarina taiwanensis]
MDPLAQLHDIVELEQVSYWPLAWGWWLLITGIMAAVFLASYMLLRRRKASAVLRHHQRTIRHAGSVADISYALKQVVLHYFPSQHLKAATGLVWLSLLNQQLPAKRQYSETQLQRIADHMYQADHAQVFAEYHAFACAWLHSAPMLRKGKLANKGGEHV